MSVRRHIKTSVKCEYQIMTITSFIRFALVSLMFNLSLLQVANASNNLYRLSAGDTISITVYGEEDLSIQELKIDNRETIDYPYLGNISLKNKSLESLQSEILTGLKGDILIDPKVNVSIVNYRNIYVNGMVNKPGAYEYEPDLTVQEAVSLAGGILTKYRRSAKTYLIPEDKNKRNNVNLEKEFEKDIAKEALPYQKVKPGDSIYVQASFW